VMSLFTQNGLGTPPHTLLRPVLSAGWADRPRSCNWHLSASLMGRHDTRWGGSIIF